MADPTRAVFWLIGVTTALRLVFAWATGLGMDESYMVASGRVLALGYFDHPPASWWLSWAATHLFGTEAPVAVRLPFIALFALSTWLMYRLGAAVFDPNAGFWAALALNLSPVFGVTTGTWVLPDGPLTCALLGAALCLVRAVASDVAVPADGAQASANGGGFPSPIIAGVGSTRWWAGAGVCAGLALFAKYSAVLSIAGAFLFLLLSSTHRHLLRQPGPWIAGGLAIAVFSPVILWNATHDWASFAFQGQRAAGPRFRPLAPLEVLGGGTLFVLPWFALPMLWFGTRALFRGPDTARLLACLAAGPILVFALVAAWSSHRVLFHWAAPGYLMLFPLLGGFIASRRWTRHVLAVTAVLVLAPMTLIGAQTRFDIFGPAFSRWLRADPTLEGIDWTSLRTELTARNLLTPDTLVGLPNWRDGGKIAIGLGPDIAVTVLHADARQFGVTRPASAHLGRDMLVLTTRPPTEATQRLFRNWTPMGTIPITLRGRVVGNALLFRGEHLVSAP